MFNKASFKDDTEKESWRRIMNIEYISSEESGYDDGDEVIITRPLPWLSATTQQFKRKLDLEIRNSKTPLARRQTKRRVDGDPSERPKPLESDIPPWILTSDNN